MSLIKSKLRVLGEKLRPTKEPDQHEQVKQFLADLRDVTESVESLLDDISDQFEKQVIEPRSSLQKILTKLPPFLQPKQVKKENSQSSEFQIIKSKIHNLNVSVDQIEDIFEKMPREEEIGQRIYELSYPGEQSVDPEKLYLLEQRLHEMETLFFDSLTKITEQMGTITQTLTTISEILNEQGIVINSIDVKIDRVETKVDQAKVTLEKISKKVTENKLLLAFIAGVIVFAIAVLILHL